MWIDWRLDDNKNGILTTGPINPIKIGNKIQWDMYTRQGVVLFEGRKNKINYKFEIDYNEGNINFQIL